MTDERRTNDDVMLAKMDHLHEALGKIDRRMEGMETAINLVAVQTNQIQNLDKDITVLFKTKEEYGRDMIEIKKWQASCPREQIGKLERQQKETLDNQWTAIKLLAGAMLTGFGILGAFIRWV